MSAPRSQSQVYHARQVVADLPHFEDRTGWNSADVLTDFSFPWTQQKTPATEFRALWNERGLRFRFDVADSNLVLAEGTDAREKVIGSDRVEIFFSTGTDLNPYYCLEIDPRGELLDYEARYHRQMNWDWSIAQLDVRASVKDPGYSVMAEIPLSTLQDLGCLYEDDSGYYLIAGLYRTKRIHDAKNGRGVEDWISWIDPQVPSPDFHVPSSFGTLRLAS